MVKKINPDYVARVSALTNRSPYFELLSMQIRTVERGRAHIEIELCEKHLQPFGAVHGGVFASLIDAAAFWALYYDIEDETAGVTTVDLKLNFLAPATTGRLIGRGRQIKMGKTLGYAEAEVTDESGRLLAHGTSTVIILPGKLLTAEPPLPPKYIE
jgi:uncharacterized protein (TIGR00369 family)